MSTARAAFRAKDLTAGMVDRAPWVAEKTHEEMNVMYRNSKAQIVKYDQKSLAP